MSQLNSLLNESAGSWKNLQSDAAKLANKWEKTGLLEGLGNENHKNSMSMILENQAKQLVTEISQDGGNPAPAGAASFSANAGTGAQWAGIALPLVRKVFGQIAAQEFVSVQPMNLPSGLVFYLDFQYGSTKPNSNSAINGFDSGDSLYGTKNSGNTPFQTEGTAGKGLYGPGRFGYSLNSQSLVDNLTFTEVAADWKDVGFDSDLSASAAAGRIFKVTVDTTNATNISNGLVEVDTAAVRGFNFLSASVVAEQINAYNYVDGDDLILFVSASALTDAADGTLYYTRVPQDNTLGDFENTATIPEINIQMRSMALVAKTRKLKAVWTPEFAQDLNAYQALDAEAEVTNILSEYISLEIDSEILGMLIQDAAAGTEYWSAENNKTYVSGDDFNVPTSTSQTGFYNTQGQWFQTLGTKVNKLSNEIHRLTLRGGANFMVVSPTVSTILESIPGFAADNSDAEKMQYAFGIQKAGQLNGRYKVYKNPYMTENTILLGYRGTQFLEAGAVFAPYIPLIMTPLVYDPETFVPRKGLLTRYAKKMLRPEFYGKIYVSGLNTL